MWNTPTNERLAQIPRLYETEHIETKDKLVYLHFFILECDWYVVEYDGEDLFFGYAILNGDTQNAEWGYFTFSELQSLSIHGIEVDCETENFWSPKPVSTIEKIKTAQ